MRFWVAAVYLACWGCGGNVRQDQAPGAGGGSPTANGGMQSAGPGGAQSTGGTQGSAGQRDGGSILLTPEQYQALMESACAGWSSDGPESVSAAIELVVDGDSAMGMAAPGVNLSRWDVTKNAVEHSFDAWGEGSYLGLIVHPNLGGDGANASPEPQDVQACLNVDAIVPLAALESVGSEQRARIEAALDVVTLNAGRPLADAYERAVSNLVSFEASAVPFVVMIVGGPPTLLRQCVNPSGMLTPLNTSELVGQIEDAYVTFSVRTYLIGLPGSEDMLQMLSLAASVGGTAPGCGPLEVCHWDLSPAQDLASELETALREIGSDIGETIRPPTPCNFTIPPAPAGQTIDLDAMTIVVRSPAGEVWVVLPDEMGDCSEGYRFVSPEEIELCPVSCQQMQGNVGNVELLFGCSPGGVP